MKYASVQTKRTYAVGALAMSKVTYCRYVTGLVLPTSYSEVFNALPHVDQIR